MLAEVSKKIVPKNAGPNNASLTALFSTITKQAQGDPQLQKQIVENFSALQQISGTLMSSNNKPPELLAKYQTTLNNFTMYAFRFNFLFY